MIRRFSSLIDKRKPLEVFLLGGNLKNLEKLETKVTPEPNKQEDIIPNEIAEAHAKLMLNPVLDKEWLPNPFIYRELKLTKEYFNNLEKVELKIQHNFITRLLLLQAFIDPSIAQPLSTKLNKPFFGMRMLTNERLSLIGSNLYSHSFLSYLYQKDPAKPVSFAQALLEKAQSELILSSFVFQNLKTAKNSESGKLISSGLETETDLQDHKKNSRLFHALIGAIYLDAGIEKVFKYLTTLVLPNIDYKVEKLVTKKK